MLLRVGIGIEALTALVAGRALGVRSELRLALHLTVKLVDVVQAVRVI